MCRSISFRLCLLTFVVCVGPVSWAKGGSIGSSIAETPVFETVHTSNAALFNRLGLSPLRISQGHHKKRLAGPEPPLNFASQNHQSYGRRHGHRDSHVYIVKLPPSPPYYAITRPHKEAKNDVKGVIKTGGNLPVGFHSNGKPGGIYHWNLPVMKKMAEKKRLAEQKILHQVQQQGKNQKTADIEENSNDIAKFDGPDTRTKVEPKKEVPGNLVAGIRNDLEMGGKYHFRNNDKRLNYGVKESGDINKGDKENNKNYRLDDSPLYKVKTGHNDQRLIWNALNDPHNSMYANSFKQKKHRKKSAMSYYAPFSLKSGYTSLQKNFSGNGKPKAFYVIEKSRKPVYYHPLLP